MNTIKCATMMLALLAVAGCDKPAEGPVGSTNAEVTVERLTTFDDCILYRIKAERTVYVARCGVDVRATEEHSESCGKNCTRIVRTEVQTVESQR